MNLSTFIVALIVAAVFFGILAVQIRNKKNGKSSCSCGGSCGACGMECGCGQTK